MFALLSGCASAPAGDVGGSKSTRSAATASAATPVAGGAWQSASGDIIGGQVTALAVSPTNGDVAYAGTFGGGVYVTTNGTSASPMWSFAGLPGQTVNALFVDSSGNVYATTDSYVLYESSDGGVTWAPNASALGLQVLTLAIDPSTPTTLYLGTNDGLYKAVDGQVAPSRILSSSAGIGAIAIAPSNTQVVYAGSLSALPQQSTDGGVTWSALPVIPLPNGAFFTPFFESFAIDPADASVVYASTSAASYKLVAGAWQTIPSLPGSMAMLAINPPGATSYANGAWGLYTSPDAGATWQRSPNAVPAPFAVQAGNSQVAYARGNAAGQLLTHTTDGAATWADASSGIHALSQTTVAVAPSDPSVVYFGFGNFDAVPQRSADGATTWSPLPLTPSTYSGYSIVSVSSTNPNLVYAGGYTGVFKFSDATSTAAPIQALAVDVSRIAVAPSDDQSVYVSSYRNGVSVTSDGGATWVAGLQGRQAPWVVVDPTNASVAYTELASPSGLYKTTDHGATWSSIDSHPFVVLAVDPTNPANLYAATDDTATTFYGSTDGGASWSPLATIPNASRPSFTDSLVSLAIDPTTPSTLYAGPRHNGLWRSTDSGQTWGRAGLDGWSPTSIAIDPQTPTTLYVGVDNGGVYKTVTGGFDP